MLFKKKIEKVFELNKERLDKERKEKAEREGTVYDPDQFREDLQNGKILEKGDLLALILAGFYTFAPIFLILIFIFILISYY